MTSGTRSQVNHGGRHTIYAEKYRLLSLVFLFCLMIGFYECLNYTWGIFKPFSGKPEKERLLVFKVGYWSYPKLVSSMRFLKETRSLILLFGDGVAWTVLWNNWILYPKSKALGWGKHPQGLQGISHFGEVERLI